MPVRSRWGDSGQAAVEAALVLPLMVFLCLGILQLTLMQQAKLLTEYAAFSAARAGIVWSGNNERMKDAAAWALLPTLGIPSAPSTGRVDLGSVATAYQRYRALDEDFQALDWGGAPEEVSGAPLRGLIRVDTLNPGDGSRLGTPWKLAGGAEWQELDFDGPDSYPESPELEEHLAKFFDVNVVDEAEVAYRRATRLSIRVRYWYELRIPFANWILFVSWYAANAGVPLGGAIDRPSLRPGASVTATGSDLSSLGGRGRGIFHGKGFATALPEEMDVLWSLASGGPQRLDDGPGRRFFIPLTATYSMRMQSNFHRKWLMHP